MIEETKRLINRYIILVCLDIATTVTALNMGAIESNFIPIFMMKHFGMIGWVMIYLLLASLMILLFIWFEKKSLQNGNFIFMRYGVYILNFYIALMLINNLGGIILLLIFK